MVELKNYSRQDEFGRREWYEKIAIIFQKNYLRFYIMKMKPRRMKYLNSCLEGLDGYKCE